MTISTTTRQVLLSIMMVSLLGLVACTKSKSNDNEFAESARGIWESGCQNYGINNEYGRTQLLVAETEFEIVNSFYEDPRCTRPTIKFLSGGTLTKHNRFFRQGIEASAEIDFLIENISAEIMSIGKVQQFNENATCELVNWQTNLSVDISNCIDFTDTGVPRTEYDIYSATTATHPSGVSTRVLYTGILRGNSEEERPSQLDIQNPYWRIGDTPESEAP